MNTINTIFKSIVKTLIVVGLCMALVNSITWKDSIKNPKNSEYVKEIAFNLGISYYEVTQADFNRRYK